MSRDSSHSYIHFHSSRHADLFEEFCRPPSSNPSNTNNSSTTTPQTNNVNTSNTMVTSDPSMIQLPGHFLPFEEIHLPAHLMPVNPEDEDDVVPDMHAAFGIQRALAQGEGSGAGERRDPGWRDLGLEGLLDGAAAGGGAVGEGGSGSGNGARREGVRTGVLLMR